MIIALPCNVTIFNAIHFVMAALMVSEASKVSFYGC